MFCSSTLCCDMVGIVCDYALCVCVNNMPGRKENPFTHHKNKAVERKQAGEVTVNSSG